MTREETVASGRKIRAALLNTIQDWIIGLYGGKHGQRFLLVDPSAALLRTGTGSFTGAFWQFGASAEIQAPLPLRAGDRITKVDWYWSYSGSGTVTFDVLKRGSNGINTVIAQTVIASGSVPAGERTTPTEFTQTLNAANAYGLRMSAGSASDRFFYAVVTYDHP